MKLEFIELDFEWPSELPLCDLRNYILSKLMIYGEPLRWAITSLTTPSIESIQKISIEAVLIIHDEKTKELYSTHPGERVRRQEWRRLEGHNTQSLLV